MEDKKTNAQRIEDADLNIIQTARVHKQMALLNAEKAIAQHETAELNYKHVVLQVYMKYGMSSQDGLDDNGNIIREVKEEEK